MSDNTLLEHKIDGLAGDVQELTNRFNEVDERLDDHSEKIQGLRQWGLGNGGPGAEERLRCTERFAAAMDKENIPPRLNLIEANIITLQHIADPILEGVQGAVNDVLDRRSRTAIEKIKAWGPIVAAALAATAVVLAAVL